MRCEALGPLSARLFLLLLVLISALGCGAIAGKPSEETARSFYQQRLSEYEQFNNKLGPLGFHRLVEFRKTDGKQSESDYVLYYEAVLECREGSTCLVNRYRATGQLHFEKTEAGWVPNRRYQEQPFPTEKQQPF